MVQSTISGIRPLKVDNAYFIKVNGEELLATISGFKDEDTLEHDNVNYRLWNPSTSKLASMIIKGMDIPLRKSSRVLYLGAASGTTVTHVSDIVTEGVVFAVEFAPMPARDLLRAIERRINVVPIISDARQPEKYPPFIDRVDILYQDVAQPNQAEIAILNANKFLCPGGIAVIAIKAKSISISQRVEDIFMGEIETLTERFEVIDKRSLEPLHHDHIAVLCRYKG